MRADLAFGFGTLAVALVYSAFARAIPASMLDDVVGAGGLPRLYGALLAVLALAQIARTVAGRGRSPARPPRASPSTGAAPAVAVTLAVGIGYAALLPWLGYPASLAALIAVTASYQGSGITGRVIAVAICGAVVFWVLFVWLLGIQQPAGVWPSLLGGA